MSKKLIGFAILMMALVRPAAGSPESEGTIVPSHINNSVYEVIVAKPSEESITYEKPLPLDLLPFAIRNDKYYSIGTAFAISETELITAAHVMVLAKSQFKETFLRDIHGNVFPIDQILKFSSRRDFSVFTVKGRLSAEHLEIDPRSQINEKVYAVGNALGQGIIIRDGLYTSNTPEEVDGLWSWIRFSAAASPGNSGGPLLNHAGKVIGVILQKSPNENLNMALPIAEVQKADDQAEIFQKSAYRLDIFDSIKRGTLDTKIKLPMGYAEFKDSVVGLKNEFSNKLLKELLTENKEDLFPRGDGSKKLIYQTALAEFPHLIMKRGDGYWDAAPPEKIDRAELGNRGHITRGIIKSTVFLKIQKPENIPLNAFYSDSKLFMDLILKGFPWFRFVGPEKIKITSLGKADHHAVHVDTYGRKWLVKSWPIPYGDQEVVTFSLPVPGGSVTMMRVDQTGETMDGHIPDLKVLSDFVYLSLDGTFKKWREYLGLKEIIPPLFSEIDLTLDDGPFRYRSKRFEFSSDSEVIKLSDQSLLTIGFGYYEENRSYVWDVTKVYLNEDNFKYNGFSITRNIKATDDLDDKEVNLWKRLLDGAKPYDMKTYLAKDNTMIGAVYKKFPAVKAREHFSVLYDISHVKTGIVDQGEMESGLNEVLKNLVVYEH